MLYHRQNKTFRHPHAKNLRATLFFYFQQIGNQVLCPHYHVTHPTDAKPESNSVFFKANVPKPFLTAEIQSHNDELLDFVTSNAVAEKSFYYAENFPYRFVNLNFMTLLGYKRINDFVTEANNSTLANVHVSDQRCYVEYLRTAYEKNSARLSFNERYQYQSSYFVKYRLQSPYLTKEISVLEWGNFFTLNGQTIVNCFVLNLNAVENVSCAIDMTKTIYPTLREDFGIHIGRNIIAYPMLQQIKINGDMVELTRVENEIFLVLANNLNQPISMEKIYASIWKNAELNLTSNALPMHISNIRRKLNPYESLIRLEYIRNKGYCLQTEFKLTRCES